MESALLSRGFDMATWNLRSDNVDSTSRSHRNVLQCSLMLYICYNVIMRCK